ncbi:MAG TPA: type VI secretion system tube protein TssD [Chitinophaga sp.]
MAFKARLNMAGKEYDVLSCNYTLNRDVDHKGRPASGVYGGTIDVEVESTEDTSVIEAMVNNQYKPMSGKVLIKKSDEDAKMKEVNFEDAYIVKYTEGINIVGTDPMKLRFTISARKLKLGAAEHVNDWPGVGAQ